MNKIRISDSIDCNITYVTRGFTQSLQLQLKVKSLSRLRSDSFFSSEYIRGIELYSVHAVFD